jgi:hypothetical protein
MSRRIVGLWLIAAGVALFVLGLRAQDALGSRMFEVWSGRPSDEALAFFAGGVVLALVGLGMALKGKKAA